MGVTGIGKKDKVFDAGSFQKSITGTSTNRRSIRNFLQMCLLATALALQARLCSSSIPEGWVKLQIWDGISDQGDSSVSASMQSK
jgi:hypothetical protein